MNLDNLQKLRDHLTTIKNVDFAMNLYSTCLVGHARDIAGQRGIDHRDFLMKFLEISADEAKYMIDGDWCDWEGNAPTKWDAIRYLDEVINEECVFVDASVHGRQNMTAIGYGVRTYDKEGKLLRVQTFYEDSFVQAKARAKHELKDDVWSVRVFRQRTGERVHIIRKEVQ